MKKNKKWFSIIIVLWLIILINLITIWILEYVIPFSKNTIWIENSSKAYYQANSWLENVLYDFKDKDAWYETWKTINTSSPVDYSYKITGSWISLPPAWEWNSDYDSDWNTISSWNPIQLEIWYGKFDIEGDTCAKVHFRVPNMDFINNKILSWAINNFPIINWQISNNNNTLNATWSYISANEICASHESNLNVNCRIKFKGRQWVDLNGNQGLPEEAGKFVTNNCFGVWSWCILKLSVINKLETDVWNISIPYLEWQFLIDSYNLPLRYSKLEAEWKSYWYKKKLDIKVSQETTNEAFDFTVFQ